MEIVIAMHAELRDEVLAGTRTSAWRPGHRDYAKGPATIRFLDKDPDGPQWTQDPPLDVVLTQVKHTQAAGKYAIFADFLGLGEDITLLEWVLA